MFELDDIFAAMYASGGRRSVPPETLLKSTVLIAMTLAEIVDIDADRLAAVVRRVRVRGRSLMRREILPVGEIVNAVEQILQLTDRVTEEELCRRGLPSRCARRPAGQRS